MARLTTDRPSVTLSPMTDTIVDLTEQELAANLDIEQLKQLVGLVEYDEDKDVFPVTGWDAIVFVVGNAVQTVHYYQSAWGMELVAYSGPETGSRDHTSYVLRSGSIRFVINGAVDPDSPLVEHHRRHGDGVVDIALEVPDVDRCIAQARKAGATVLREPEDLTDEHGTVRVAAIATYGETRHTLIQRVSGGAPGRGMPARTCRATSPGRAAGSGVTASPSGCSRRSTTSSATSSSAGWTSGSGSTTRSWAS